MYYLNPCSNSVIHPPSPTTTKPQFSSLSTIHPQYFTAHPIPLSYTQRSVPPTSTYLINVSHILTYPKNVLPTATHTENVPHTLNYPKNGPTNLIYSHSRNTSSTKSHDHLTIRSRKVTIQKRHICTTPKASATRPGGMVILGQGFPSSK